jgi:uncharacterized protein YkwD/serine/threonine protein kinase
MAFPSTLEKQFNLVQRIPSGKLLEYYRVQERQSRGKECLLRLLPSPLSNVPSIVEEFHRFFTRFSNITNRTYIPRVNSVVGDTGGDVYILEEFVSGTPLPQYLESIRSSRNFTKDAVEVLARVCEALHHAHQKDLYHLCIRPEDIRINDNNPAKVKLVGFGVQVFVRGTLQSLHAKSRSYLAPEVLNGQGFKGYSDTYSLAKVISEVFPETLSSGNFLQKALSKNPLERYQSAREFEARLREIPQEKKGLARFLFTLPFFGKQADEPTEFLTIFSVPHGATLITDGKNIGITNFSGLKVPWKNKLEITLEKQGYEKETLSLRSVPEDKKIVVKLKALYAATQPKAIRKPAQSERPQTDKEWPRGLGEKRGLFDTPLEYARKKLKAPFWSWKWIFRCMGGCVLMGVLTAGVLLYVKAPAVAPKPPTAVPPVTQAPPKPQPSTPVSTPAIPPKIHDRLKPPRSRNLVFNSGVEMDKIIDMVDHVLRFTNEERARERLSPLESSAALAYMAQIHSENMCESKVLEHDANVFPDGWKNLKERLKLFEIDSGDENIAIQRKHDPQTWARDLVKKWMISHEHRQNILSSKWKYIGIGVCPCGTNDVYAVQVFSNQEGTFR